mmetsp:Transcript_15087/g.20678  ORF Transcript_15087/g.20678 Transcript_15087/m.20678 type:complete len:163 (+) Transcript_15087:38-526(+)
MIYWEFIFSAIIGFLLSVILILYSSGPVKETVKKEEDSLDIEKEKEIANVNIYLDEEKVLLKTKFIQNSLGISSNDMQEAVRKTNLELRSGTPAKDVELISSFSVLFDFFIGITVFVVAFYSLNIISKGEMGRIAAGLFQTELESFNFEKLPFYQHFLKLTT